MRKNGALFIVVLTLSTSMIVSTVNFCSAQAGLVTFINTDTPWVKASSPYTLTGPIVVSTGVTLTVNPGVTIDLNGYYLYVNGTLRAIGSTSDNIRIFGGDINYGNSSQVGANSIFENCVLNSTITSNKPLAMNNNTINNRVTAGPQSTFSNNLILAQISTGSSSTFTRNNMSNDLSMGDSCTLSENTINGDTTTGTYATITNNIINGSKIVLAPFGGHSYTIALTVDGSSTITNNSISGGVTATSSTISNNIITGGAPFTDWAGRPEDATSAVSASGNSSVISNLISSSTGGYGLLIRSGYTVVSGNAISNGVRIAGDSLIDGNLIHNGGTGIRVGEIFISAFNDIDYGHGNSVIRNNVITGNYVGIGSTQSGGSAVIEHNLISNNTNGVDVNSEVTLLNNTISNSSIAIRLQVSPVALSYNNIIDYTQNSLYLSSVSTPVNATYNWWGTTDTQAINLTIHDFKYDLNLGTVSFVPFLTAQNPQAPSTEYTIPPPIPEFPNWAILPLLLALLLSALVLKACKITERH